MLEQGAGMGVEVVGGWQKKMEEEEKEGVEKTAGSTECFRFVFPVSDLSELFGTES